MGGVDAAWRQSCKGKTTPGGAALPPLSYPPFSTDIRSLHLCEVKEEKKKTNTKGKPKSAVFTINVSLHECFILSRKIVSIQPDFPFSLNLEIILRPSIYIFKRSFFQCKNFAMIKRLVCLCDQPQE